MKITGKKQILISIGLIVFVLVAFKVAYHPSNKAPLADVKTAPDANNVSEPEIKKPIELAQLATQKTQDDSGISTNVAATKNQGLSPAEVAKTQDPIVAPVLPVEAARLIGRNAIIKTKKLANGVLPVIDPILNVNVLGFEKGTGTVQLANFKDSTGVTISNPVIVPDGNLNEGVYVSFYRMKDLQEKFIGRHVVWYNSIVSTVKTFPINFKDSTGKFETKDNTIYLIDYIYTN